MFGGFEILEGGISKWSGLIDVALEGGFVTKPSNGWYQKKGSDEKLRLKDTYTKEFWLPILSSKEFQRYVEDTYKISASSLIQEDVTDDDIAEDYENA